MRNNEVVFFLIALVKCRKADLFLAAWLTLARSRERLIRALAASPSIRAGEVAGVHLSGVLWLPLSMFRQLPNIITFSRIAVLIALVWLVHQGWTGAATLAFFCILYGAISDFVDGYIARKYDLVTDFGKIMDATVDKVMVLGAFVLILYLGLLEPIWLHAPLVALIAVRELGITWMRTAAARKGLVLAAEKAGKRKTIWQTTSICVLLAVPMFERDVAAWTGWPMNWVGLFVHLNGYLYFYYAAFLTITSGAMYVSKYGALVFGRSTPPGGTSQ